MSKKKETTPTDAPKNGAANHPAGGAANGAIAHEVRENLANIEGAAQGPDGAGEGASPATGGAVPAAVGAPQGEAQPRTGKGSARPGEAIAHAAQAAGEDIAQVGADIRQQWETGVAASGEELDVDRRQWDEMLQRQKSALHEAAEVASHPAEWPQDIGAQAAKAAARVKQDAEAVAHDVTHPKEDLQRAAQRLQRDGEALKRDMDAFSQTLHSPVDKQKLPVWMKVFGILCIVAAAVSGAAVAESIVATVHYYTTGGLDAYGLSSIVVIIIQMVVRVLLVVTFLLFGIRLLRNRRRLAAITTNILFVLLLAGVLCTIMLSGMNWILLGYLGLLVLMVALQTYLDPSLSQERRLHRHLRDQQNRQAAEAGTLGLDETGKGYITLNFYNLFWIFVVCSILGLIIETIFHFIVFGDYQDRAGLLFGPFSPIYGCGGVLMTVFLNRFHKSNLVVIFFVSAIIGGAFEYFTSWFMQYAFGAVAWNYTGMWLSIGGRTCGLFMAMWGLLGVVWIKLLLPVMLRLINLIPWNWRYGVTAACAALMLVDCVMTLQALDCWYERLSGDQVATPIQQFYAKDFDNGYMENRFQSMTIHPDDAVRQGRS